MPQLDSTNRDSMGANQEPIYFKCGWDYDGKNGDRFLSRRDPVEVRHFLRNEAHLSKSSGSDSERCLQTKHLLMDPQAGSLLSRLAPKDTVSPFPSHVVCAGVCTPKQTGPTSQTNKVAVVQPPHYSHLLTPIIACSKDHFSCGVPPSHLCIHMDPQTRILRQPHISDSLPTYCSFSPEAAAQFPHALGWLVSHQSQTVYPMAQGGFNHLYPTALTITASVSNCVPSRLLPQTASPCYSFHTAGIPHVAVNGPRVGLEHRGRELANHLNDPVLNHEDEKKNHHIKKPLNAFMLYMKDVRAKVVSECTLKESAAINQILGRRWHTLSKEEQGKYYELAKKERQRHMQLYPGWSARDNYGKKKKRKREKLPGQDHAARIKFNTQVTAINMLKGSAPR